MRTDGASILRATAVRDLFDAELITAEASMPRVPQQMGQNESAGRYVVRSSNAMRARARAAGQKCGPELAALAIEYACEVHNRTFTKTWRGMTCPLQLATGVQPDLSHLHVFGAPAWSRLTMQERPDKLHALGIKGDYVGLARGYKGARILIRDAATLQQGKLGNKPAVHIHEYSKLGIDMKVDDASLYRLGRKLLPTTRQRAMHRRRRIHARLPSPLWRLTLPTHRANRHRLQLASLRTRGRRSQQTIVRKPRWTGRAKSTPTSGQTVQSGVRGSHPEWKARSYHTPQSQA
jgi:hypothetical protein